MSGPVVDVWMREVSQHTERMRQEREAFTAKRNSYLLADAARRVVDERVPFEPVMAPPEWRPPRAQVVNGIPGPDGCWLVHPDEYRRLESRLEKAARR